jgi:ribonuclease VapC
VIVDSSAIMAVAFREPGYEVLIEKLTSSPTTAIGTPTLGESGIVMSSRLHRDAREVLRQFLYEFEIDEVPFGEMHWPEAVRAWWRFGRGRHPANLNFGDCLAYAVARVADEPLLFVGDDFASTDIRSA